jgi:hypothetical protein
VVDLPIKYLLRHTLNGNVILRSRLKKKSIFLTLIF